MTISLPGAVAVCFLVFSEGLGGVLLEFQKKILASILLAVLQLMCTPKVLRVDARAENTARSPLMPYVLSVEASGFKEVPTPKACGCHYS